MKISEKLKKTDAPLNKKELEDLIKDVETLENILKTEQEEVQRLKDELKASQKEMQELKEKKETPEKEVTKTETETEKTEPEIKYITGPTDVSISYNEEETKIPFRITGGVAKNRSGYVFKGITEETPEKEKGIIYKEHKISGKKFYAIYKR